MNDLFNIIKSQNLQIKFLNKQFEVLENEIKGSVKNG